MSKRKPGGLDYTPRAFPGARDPDGPAPGLEEELIKLGLAEPKQPQEARASVRPGVQPGATAGAKKRGSLDYSPKAFPGARDPDGPAPGMEAQLIKMGLAERAEPPPPRPQFRQDAHEAHSAPPAPRQRMASPAPMRAPAQETAARQREPPSAWTPQRDDELARSARSARAISELLEEEAAVRLPVVPPEPAPRPAPLFVDALPPPVSAHFAAAPKPAAKPPARASRRIEQLKRQPSREDRVRLSLRLVSNVDSKLSDLAHLRGLDRNTAVSIAIVQDWIGCFGGAGGG